MNDVPREKAKGKQRQQAVNTLFDSDDEVYSPSRKLLLTSLIFAFRPNTSVWPSRRRLLLRPRKARTSPTMTCPGSRVTARARARMTSVSPSPAAVGHLQHRGHQGRISPSLGLTLMMSKTMWMMMTMTATMTWMARRPLPRQRQDLLHFSKLRLTLFDEQKVRKVSAARQKQANLEVYFL